jgi:deoxyribonuclease-4
MLYIGSHTSYLKGKGLLGVVEESLSYNSNTFMFYTGSNQSAQRFPIDKELTSEAHKLMIENNIDKTKCIVHAPFIINLANNSDEEKYNFYVNFLKQELNRCIELDIPNIVLHPGSFTNLDRQTGIENIARGLNLALKNKEGINLLLEYMSGKGTEVGSSIDDLKGIIDLLEEDIYKKVFVCLDTCHINDSGIDIENFDEFLKEFDEKIGIEKIKCIHINDSYNNVGAHKDRHANIGYGTIGFDKLINIIYNPKLDNIPKILETPWINRNEKNEYPPYKFEIEMIRNKKFHDYINNRKG